jgi:hypothetical protein
MTMMTFTFAPSARFDDQPAPFPFHTHREMLAHPNVVRWAKLPGFARFAIDNASWLCFHRVVPTT